MNEIKMYVSCYFDHRQVVIFHRLTSRYVVYLTLGLERMR